MDYRGKFMVKPGEEVKLSKIDPDETFKTDKDAETLELTAKYTKELTELQNHLYAENRHSLLIVLQGMDAAGKDGVINHVLAPLNPNQQNQRINTPSAPTVRLCPGMARTNFASLRTKVGLPSLSRYLPQRGPRIRAPMKEEMPPTM